MPERADVALLYVLGCAAEVPEPRVRQCRREGVRRLADVALGGVERRQAPGAAEPRRERLRGGK